MDDGSFLGAIFGALSLALVLGLAVALPFVVAALNHVLTILVGASIDAIRARHRTRIRL